MSYQVFEVSVVIPVYRAERFVERAIKSVLDQEEAREILLIEDNSPDRCLEICTEYADRYDRIKLLRHPNNENRGAGASRNLGIRHASCAYIAFLDADDMYLPNRFEQARKIFENDTSVDGVYEYLGTHYDDIEYREAHLSRVGGEITGMTRKIAPENLFEALVCGRSGQFHLDTFVIKKEALTDKYLFDESLIQGQDTDLLYRLSSRYKLVQTDGQNIVALRGVHKGNRVFDREEAKIYRKQYLHKSLKNLFYGSLNRKANIALVRRYIAKTRLYYQFIGRVPFVPYRVKTFPLVALYILTHPAIAYHILVKSK